MSLADFRGQTVVLCFSSIGCPVSNDYRQRLADLTRRYSASRRATILRINVGRGLPLAGKGILPLEAASTEADAGRPTRLLMDSNCDVAGLYAVDLTPTFFVVDSHGIIQYRGSFDDNRNAAQVKSHFCEDALEDVLHDRPVAEALTAPFGCAIIH